MTMADTIAVMNNGRIEQMGPPEELYDLPATTFAANFLGQTNLVSGSVTGKEGDDLTLEAFGARLAAPSSRARANAGDVWIGVRPEKVLLASPGERSAGVNVLSGAVIRDISFVGVSTQYVVVMPWGQELMVFEQNHTTHRRFQPGDIVDLQWAPEHTFILDAAQDALAGAEVEDD